MAFGSLCAGDLLVGDIADENVHERVLILGPDRAAFLELHHHGDYLDDKSKVVEAEMLAPLYHFVHNAQHQQLIKESTPPLLGALVWGAFMGLVMANRKGLIVELNKKTLDLAEESMWAAIRR